MQMKLFALNASREYGQAVAKYLGTPLSLHDEYCFDDGECYVAPNPRIEENVRGCDVFVIQSVYTDEKESVNDKLMKLLIFIGALHDASAERITLVLPYYPYARQDRKTLPRAPITTKYLAHVFTALWTNRVLTMEIHNPTAPQNGFSFPIDLLEAKNLFARHAYLHFFRGYNPEQIVVMSPDSGGLGRARNGRDVLSVIYKSEAITAACLDKIHRNPGECKKGDEIKGYGIMGDVKDKSVLIYDDMISSGKSVLECVVAAKRHGAREVFVCAAHGLFVGAANDFLDNSFIKGIAVLDTIRPFRLTNSAIIKKLTIIPTCELFAEAIGCIHNNKSISDLLNNHLSL